MLTTFSLRDYYDWGNDTFYFPSLKVPSINYIVKTVWNENQSVDQATITVVSY